MYSSIMEWRQLANRCGLWFGLLKIPRIEEHLGRTRIERLEKVRREFVWNARIKRTDIIFMDETVYEIQGKGIDILREASRRINRVETYEAPVKPPPVSPFKADHEQSEFAESHINN